MAVRNEGTRQSITSRKKEMKENSYCCSLYLKRLPDPFAYSHLQPR
jgi:hypothetical protein